MLSQTAEYALRAVLYLAEHGKTGPISVGVLSHTLSLPRNYLSKTLHVLAKRRILSSVRGPGGGFQLAIPPDSISLLEVVAPFDEIGGQRQCLLGGSRCSDDHPCPAHGRWKEVADQLLAFFQQTTVEDLIHERQGRPVRGSSGSSP